MGRPWPVAALATSLSLNSFHTDSSHPPDGTVGPCITDDSVCTQSPLEQAEWRCCVEGCEAWMPSKERWAMDGPSRRPSEQHRSEETRSAAQGRMMGQAFLLTFVPAGQGATSKSETPGRAEQMCQKNTLVAIAQLLNNTIGFPIHWKSHLLPPSCNNHFPDHQPN